jgi:Domain of unknown function (DUF4381)
MSGGGNGVMEQWSNEMNVRANTPLLQYSITAALLAEEFHDIAPPVDYSLIPPWVIFLVAFCSLALVGLIVWLIIRARRRPVAPKSPRQRALDELEMMEFEVEQTPPYRFSIRVSDVLRSYVTEQFALPVTKQTSVEFLTALAKASPFSAEEKMLLEDFLNRCDLIKFARYDATTADSCLLLEEAIRFVKGGELVTASV